MRCRDVFGAVSYAAGGSERLGVLAVGAFFVVGVFLVMRVPATRKAGQDDRPRA